MVEKLDPRLEAILDQALRDHALEEAGEVGSVMDHPTADVLVDFQEGRLEATEAAEVHAHLEVCIECTGDLERLGHWDPAEQPDERLLPSAQEIAEQRRRFEERIAPPMPRGRSVWSPWVLRLSLPLAATLILGAVGLGFWLGVLWEASPEPEPILAENLLFHTLRAEQGGPRRSSGEEILFPLGFDALVLRLPLGDLTPHENYWAEILEDGGQIHRSWKDLARQPNGSFVLAVSRGDLKAGSYIVRLLARDGEQEALLATFRFLLDPTPTRP